MRGVRVIDKIPQFIKATTQMRDIAVGRMAQDIEILAKARAPYRSGKLTRGGYSTKLRIGHHRVVFDEAYAAYQERGRREDGSHVVRKYTTPSTGKDFLKDAGRGIAAKAVNYLRQALGSAKIGI